MSIKFNLCYTHLLNQKEEFCCSWRLFFSFSHFRNKRQHHFSTVKRRINIQFVGSFAQLLSNPCVLGHQVQRSLEDSLYFQKSKSRCPSGWTFYLERQWHWSDIYECIAVIQLFSDIHHGHSYDLEHVPLFVLHSSESRRYQNQHEHQNHIFKS
jgi:hypothetical protein